MSLIGDILSRISGVGDKRLFVVDNRDGFIMRHRQAIEDSYNANCRIFGGTSLDLRLVRDYEMKLDTTSRFIFVRSEDFELLDDVADDCERVTINVQRFFGYYHWATIRNLSLSELQWLYEQRQLVPLDAAQTRGIVCEYHRSPDYRKQAIDGIKSEWDRVVDIADFRHMSQWMPALARQMAAALELESWGEFDRRVETLNDKFQEYLLRNYETITQSGPSAKSPKIVTQIAPFIARQDPAGKYALIVIDGMNFWQAMMLANTLEDTVRGIAIKYDAALSWLPSETELSRQAIFLGEQPSQAYVQSPHAENKLWTDFWKSRRIPTSSIFYQHGGSLEPNANSTRIGYVNTDLDDMMHGAQNYKYLYDDTVRWIKDTSIVGDIGRLLANGFKIFLTSDHGNIEGVPYRSLSPADRAGARHGLRYIALCVHADASLFEQNYSGHVERMPAFGRTYYALGREIFSTQTGIVTHGGTHFLEAIVPFFTIAINQ